MDDLARLLTWAIPDDKEPRRVGLRDRIAGRAEFVAALEGREDSWELWSDSARDADLLVDELVALVLTQLLRVQGLDAGTFDAGEALVTELVERAGIPPVVLGQTQELESIDHTRASVLLRFPGSRVWDLPFLEHEIGHHAVAHLRHIEPALADGRPLEEATASVTRTLIAEGGSNGVAESHAAELVADVIATSAGGPTYPVACLCLRVPAGTAAGRVSNTHPAWRERVATMCATLLTLSDHTGKPRYRRQCSRLVDRLAAAILGKVPEPSQAGLLAADRVVKDLLRHRPGLIYQAGDEAIEVAAHLQSGEPLPPRGCSVTAIIDGAWRWRLQQTSHKGEDKVAALVVDYCRIVAEGVLAHGT